MSATLVLPESLAVRFEEISSDSLETAGVLLVSAVTLGGNEFRLLGREYYPVPDAAYISRKEDSLTIASEGYVPALARAETIGATALWVHTHPGMGSSPSPSAHDEIVDEQLAETFRLRGGTDFYGAVIFSPSQHGLRFTGHVARDGGKKCQVTRLWVVGDRFRLSHSEAHQLQEPIALFDRNVRAFGRAVQNTLSDLTVGVVGCGGTGSAVAEQLVRLGVRKFVLMDPDTLSDTNLTRVYGSTPPDVGKPKVDIAVQNIKAIAPDADCEPVNAMLNVAAAARRLVNCDIVFGCSDDNAGRLVLSRLPTYMLTPVIDCGVLMSSTDTGELVGIDGRVTVVVPENACLLCRGRIDVARAAAELMTPEERNRLATEGYAPALGGTEPAVVAFTTFVAATSVSELLERLVGYGPTPRPSEVLLRLHERQISTNLAVPRLNHYCSITSGKLGLGVTEPFLDLAWKA